MNILHRKKIIYLSIVLAIFLGIVSFFGAFIKSTYKKETLSLAVQGMGQDLFDLFIVVPLLVITLALSIKGSSRGVYILSGTVLYILYSFFIYSFGIHFNQMFLFYCIILGSSFYLFTILFTELNNQKSETRYGSKVPVKSTAVYFIIIAVIFYMLWLSDVIPTIINDSIPESVSEYNLLVNPVHVLDISLMLPALIIASVLLLKGNKTGLMLAPVLLVFLILLSFALISMVIMLKVKEISEDISLVIIFSVILIISSVFLYAFLKSIKR